MPSIGIKNCPLGHACKHAHTQNEINFHPLTFRTVKCTKTSTKCTTPFCPYFHKKAEKREPQAFLRIIQISNSNSIGSQSSNELSSGRTTSDEASKLALSP